MAIDMTNVAGMQFALDQGNLMEVATNRLAAQNAQWVAGQQYWNGPQNAQIWGAISGIQEPVKRPDPPKVTNLKRTVLVAAEPLQSVAEERLNLAERARKVLGYKILGERIDKEERTKRCKWECAQAFAKLGFDPLDTVKVAAYKQQMIAAQGGMAWAIVTLDKYAEAVPEFALSRAIELKDELPAATFEVEYMRHVPDPFLVMVYGTERYYIDVWDEPLFEGRRTV